MTDLQRTDFSRVFSLQYGAGPAANPTYQGFWRAGAFTWNQGDVTLHKIPDPDQYGAFLTVMKVPGEPDNPQLTLMARYTRDVSALLKLAKAGCDVDYQIHMGACKDPRDFNLGWEKVLILERARITNYGTDDLGALTPDDRDVIDENVTVVGEDAYEVSRLLFGKVADANIVREVVDITVCDSATCGFCGIPSDGCQLVIAVTVAAGGSPGFVSKLILTTDGGATWSDTVINSLAANVDALAVQCVSNNVIVLASTGISYLPLTNAIAHTGTFTLVTTGFVLPAGAPREFFSLGPRQTWIIGAGGYIYFTTDPTAGVSIQDAGVATTQQLNAIHGYDSQNLIAVGNNNAVVVTRNGGNTWSSVLGPTGGVNLNTVWMRKPNEWFVGTAGGQLWYTRDGGTTWVLKSFSGSGSGVVRDINFVTPSVGYMSHDTAGTVGRLFRTIDGGSSWYILPEEGGAQSVPSNARLNRIATCTDPNIVYAGGLAPGGSADGILVKGA